MAVDSTSIRLHGSLYNHGYWRQSRRRKVINGKLHTTLDLGSGSVQDFRVTYEAMHDLLPFRDGMDILRGKTYVFDRAYTDLKLWLKIRKAGANFVTRLKTSLRNDFIKIRINDLPRNQVGVLYDGPWSPGELACYRAKIKPKTEYFRQIIYRSPEDGRLLHFITSDLERNADAIAMIYRKRWQVELLYRWLKTHLSMRTVFVRSSNGVRSAIALGVLTHLLLVLRKILSGAGEPLLEIYRGLRVRLLQKILMDQGLSGRGPPGTAAGSGFAGGRYA